MKALLVAVSVFSAVPAFASPMGLDFDLWLDGQRACGDLRLVDEKEKTVLCETRTSQGLLRVSVLIEALKNHQYKINGLVEKIEEDGKVKAVSRPTLLSLENQEASIAVGDGRAEDFSLKVTVSR